MRDRIQRLLRHVAKAILITIAVLYFLIDLLFLSIVRPLRRRLMELRIMRGLRAWVDTLNRYAALMLLIVPWLILEPIKPIALLLFAHKHHTAAALLMIGGEIVKLTLFEQLFDMTKPKLMTFPWFAWAYGHWRAAVDYLRSRPISRRIRYRYLGARNWVRRRLRTVADAANAKEPR